jgi:hypothetical protein
MILTREDFELYSNCQNNTEMGCLKCRLNDFESCNYQKALEITLLTAWQEIDELKIR